jgi:hypothetical protein
MSAQENIKAATDLPTYDRNIFDSGCNISCPGGGMIGGKAPGPAEIKDVLKNYFDSSPFPEFDVSIPRIATLPNMNVEFSQGSRFFHNLSSFQICYFLIYYNSKYKIDWLWLNNQNEIALTDFLRYTRISLPLEIKVDGRTGRGIVKK